MILHISDILPYIKHIRIQNIVSNDYTEWSNIADPGLCDIAGSIDDSCNGCAFYDTSSNTCATSQGHGPDFYTTLDVLRAELSAYPELLV